MVVARAQYTKGHRLPIQPFSQEELDQTAEELAAGKVNYAASKREWVFKREVENAIANIHDRVDELQVDTFSQPPIAYQFVQITAAMLASSDDPDDVAVERSVLTTASQTVNEFNWMRSGGLRSYKVLFGPGDGVPTHHVIVDRDDVNLWMGKMEAVEDASIMTSSNVCRPYGMEGVRLQFGEWRPAGSKFEFWPSSIAVGTWVYLEQQLPMVDLL